MSKQMDFINGLTLEHQSQLESPTLIQQNPKKAAGVGADPYWLTRDFHYAFDMLIPPRPILSPSVSVRELRLKLILEEFEELAEAMGFEILVDLDGKAYVQHVEASRYDPVETADALGDLNVVVNGTGIEFGLPMPFVNVEIFLSNMSKLDEKGEPIVNQCKHYGGDKEWMHLNPADVPIPADFALCHNRVQDNDCNDTTHLINPNQPKGKILKSPGYRKPNITRIIYDHLEEESK